MKFSYILAILVAIAYLVSLYTGYKAIMLIGIPEIRNFVFNIFILGHLLLSFKMTSGVEKNGQGD